MSTLGARSSSWGRRCPTAPCWCSSTPAPAAGRARGWQRCCATLSGTPRCQSEALPIYVVPLLSDPEAMSAPLVQGLRHPTSRCSPTLPPRTCVLTTHSQLFMEIPDACLGGC
jgi:hypothetical protein